MRVRCLSTASGRRWGARDANATPGEKNKERFEAGEIPETMYANERTSTLTWNDLTCDNSTCPAIKRVSK